MTIDKLAENLGLEAEEFYEILQLYVETTSSDLKELKSALIAGDGENVHQKAHSIKGASGNIGLTELYELAKAIDDRARDNSMNGLGNLVQDFTVKYEKLAEEFEKGG